MQEKYEKIIDETYSNNDFTTINTDTMYNNRLYACQQINQKLNLNLTVVKNK